MNESNVVELKAPVEDALGELLKEGARQLLAQAIEAEVAELLIRSRILPIKRPSNSLVGSGRSLRSGMMDRTWDPRSLRSIPCRLHRGPGFAWVRYADR